jgi:EAL domain-containing protein (putative c-di-GMP-specific phosphodiesterase class I)
MERVFAYLGSGKVAKNYYEYIVIHLSSSLGMQRNFTDRVWTLRNQYNVNPSFICFAISDTVYDMMGGGLYDNSKKLTLQGYRLAIDGYGNGYSNIKNIVEMPISNIRLDRSMITEVETDQGKALLAGLIQMLINIPIPVVAPAVDDVRTKEMLTEMGCDLMQGKYFDQV